MTRLSSADISRILTPRERSVLIVCSRARSRVEAQDQLAWAGGSRASGYVLSLEEIERVLALARRKLEVAARSSSDPQPRGRAAGKPVTFPRDVIPRPPKEAVMEQQEQKGPDRPIVTSKLTGRTADGLTREEAVAEREGRPGEGIADRFVREAEEEAGRVVADLARLRFRADQVMRVLRALNLPVPPEVRWVSLGVNTDELAAMAAATNGVAVEEVDRLRSELTARNQEVIDLKRALEARRQQDGSRIAAERAESPATVEAAETPAEQPQGGKMTPQERGKAGAAAAAANRTFLDAGEYRTLEAIEAQLRAMESDITAERLVKEWGLGGRHQAERVVRHFYEAGVIRLQRFPDRGEGATFHVGPSAFDRLPVPAGGWEQMPAWAGSERKSLAVEIAARQQGAIVAVLEHVGMPMVPKEVTEELAANNIQIPQARVADYMRDIERAALILRTGHNRRAATQTAGRTSVEYRALVVRKQPEDPGEAQQLATVRDDVCSRKEAFAPSEVIEKTGLSEDVVRAALTSLIERGVIVYVGFDDLELYEYVKPDGPGAAAQIDAARRGTGAETNGNGGGAPVAGTGGRPRSSDKETDAMLAKADKAGAEVTKTGSGHFRVKNKKTGRGVIVYATPGKQSRDKNRKKLAGIGIAV